MARRRDLDAALDKVDDVQPLQQGRGLRGLVGASGRAEVEVGTETELSQSETDEFERCEAVIQRGLRTFFEVGAALLRIRELRLYRAEYATFEEYCQERWEMGRRYVNQIIAASQVRENLGAMAPKLLPENERQARPLTKLEPELQRAAWQHVLATTAAEGRITASYVEQVVQEMIAQTAPAPVAERAIEGVPVPQAVPPAPAPAHGNWLHRAVQPDEEEAALAPLTAGELWPDNLAEIEVRLAAAGWERTDESETRISYQRGDETLHIVKPPAPNVVQIHLVAHASEDMEQIMTWLHERIGAAFSHKPASSRLPTYPERQRVYGAFAIGHPSDADGVPLADVAALRERNADLEQQLATVRTILAEHFTRAQQDKPNAQRGDVVAPLLYALEQVWFELQATARTKQ